MVPLGVLRNSTTGTTIVIQFDFHCNSIQNLAECVVRGRAEGFCCISPSLVDVILQKGPTLCSASQRTVLSNITVIDPTRISVSSEKSLLSLQSCFRSPLIVGRKTPVGRLIYRHTPQSRFPSQTPPQPSFVLFLSVIPKHM